MKSVREWVFSQVLSNSSISSRSTSHIDNNFQEGPEDEELDDQEDSVRSTNLLASPVVSETSSSTNGCQDNHSNPALPQVSTCHQSQCDSSGRKMDPLTKVEDLKVKFFRLLQRLGQSPENLLVAKVLYRMHLATLIRVGENDLKRVTLKSDRSRSIAFQQEAAGEPELDFSCKILVLGKTGVGKSATINSILDQVKTVTNAFQPATNCIQEIMGTVNGIKITFIDTPGLLPVSARNFGKNKKIMLSVKRFIKKSPPDVVLFFERLDDINSSYGDLPLLKLITKMFGSTIWFNTILVMTHSSSSLPEGPDGNVVSYESYVSFCTELLQRCIHQAVFDSLLDNPVLLVENHPHCKRNITGEKVLPNGQAWRSQFLLLCFCTKILADVNSFMQFHNSLELGQINSTRQPSLPHLLSSLLRHRSTSNPNGTDNYIDEVCFEDVEDEDEYDQLPSIRILKKSQFEKLSKSQKKAYLDELDYRETLYLKKQLKDEYRNRREKNLSKERSLMNNKDLDEQQTSPEVFQLPDMSVPPTFDSDCPIHRYRCLVTSDQWLVRPVLDPQGWDHDVGFDGINLETVGEVKKNVFAMIKGQMSKDKEDFSIHSECAAVLVDPSGPTYSVGIDVQSSGKDIICTVLGNTKLRNLKHNITDCGVSLTSCGKNYFVGGKIEDAISVGKRLKFFMNAGFVEGARQMASGGSIEATLRGSDYPVRNDNVTLTMTVLSFNKEMVLGGGLQSEFSLNRTLRVSVNCNLNSRKMGQICIKTNSTEHLQLALVAVFPFVKALWSRKSVKNLTKQAMDLV